MIQSPCKSCKTRVLGCHSTCDDYIKWSKERSEEIKYERKQKNVIKQSDFTGTSPKPGTSRKIRGTNW